MNNDMEMREEIAKRLVNDTNWSDGGVAYELPAIVRIANDLVGAETPPYSAKNPTRPGEYTHQFARRGQFAQANAVLNNLSSRVQSSLNRNKSFKSSREDALDTAINIANGARALGNSGTLYRELGLLNRIYSDGDPLESRYAFAAEMYEQFKNDPSQNQPNDFGEEQEEQQFDPFGDMSELDGDPGDFGDGDGSPGDFDADENDNQDGESDFLPEDRSGNKNPGAKQLQKFYDYVAAAVPWLELISKYIDHAIETPAKRHKTTRIQDDEGDEIDLEDLSLDKLSRISQESMSIFASNRKLAALTLDDMTYAEQYKTESKKYIDVFVVDNSGSMSGDRIFRAAAFIYNRLDKVIKNQAMLAIVQFDDSTNLFLLPRDLAKDEPRWLINTPEKAKWVQRKLLLRYARMTGGGTNIPLGLIAGVKIAEKMQEWGGVLPNVTIVTDDDNGILYMSSTLRKMVTMPVNGIALANNDSLIKFCDSTGGMYNALEQIEMNAAKLQGAY